MRLTKIRRTSYLPLAAATVLMALLLAGCDTIPFMESERAANVDREMVWVDPQTGKPDPDRSARDWSECIVKVDRYTDAGSNVDFGFEYRRCMRLKGWKQVPKVAAK